MARVFLKSVVQPQGHMYMYVRAAWCRGIVLIVQAPMGACEQCEHTYMS